MAWIKVERQGKEVGRQITWNGERPADLVKRNPPRDIQEEEFGRNLLHNACHQRFKKPSSFTPVSPSSHLFIHPLEKVSNYGIPGTSNSHVTEGLHKRTDAKISLSTMVLVTNVLWDLMKSQQDSHFNVHHYDDVQEKEENNSKKVHIWETYGITLKRNVECYTVAYVQFQTRDDHDKMRLENWKRNSMGSTNIGWWTDVNSRFLILIAYMEQRPLQEKGW